MASLFWTSRFGMTSPTSICDDKEVRISLCDAAQACNSVLLPALRVGFDEGVLTNFKNVRANRPSNSPTHKAGKSLPDQEENPH